MVIARLCPKGRVTGAYTFKVPVWHVNVAKLARPARTYIDDRGVRTGVSNLV